MRVLQLLSCYPYVRDTLNWRMVADKKSQIHVQDRLRIWKADTDVNSTKHANIVISNEPFQHIYWINIATLESAMNYNWVFSPSCSDSRRRTRRLTTDQSRPPFCSANDNVVVHLLASYHSLFVAFT